MHPRILIIDHDDKNLRLSLENASLHSSVVRTESNRSGIALTVMEFNPDVIFLGMGGSSGDGIDVCRLLKNNAETKTIPIIAITDINDTAFKLRAIDAGVSDILVKPIDSADIIIKTRSYHRIREFHAIAHSHRTLRASYLDTIHRLITVAEIKDEEAAAHVKRMGLYCSHFAKHLGWDDERTEMIKYAASMHDIGKIGIPPDILLRPARLTPEELALVRTHTTIGKKILHGSESPLIQMAEKIAVSHHERWDGSGYPAGLRGTEIPLEGRICAFADQYDTLRSSRPYKPQYDHVKAYRILMEGNERIKPQHFDPTLLAIFRDTHRALESIYDLDQDLSRYDRIKDLKPFVLLEQDKVHSLLSRMTERTYPPGEDITVQGMNNDYYYIIKSGQVAVLRREKGAIDAEQVDLLGEGDGFGEEALVQNDLCKTTCRAVEETAVYALDKSDFNGIMKLSFLQHLFVEDMNVEAYHDKYVLIDTRVPQEYEQEHIKGAVNIPLEILRRKYEQLDPAKSYVTYCTNDRRGLIAAFLLKNYGFNAVCLRGGISSWTGPTAIGPNTANRI